MGRIGRAVQFNGRARKGAKLRELLLSADGGNNITTEHFSSSGDDSFPLVGDYAIAIKIPRSGGEVTVGYIDPKNLHKSNSGDKRIYSRNSSGDEVADLWIKNDGSISGRNAAGFFELLSSGEFIANGARIPVDGDVITSDGVSLRNHNHNQGADSAGDSQAATSTPNATE